ncbi:protein-tyrosine phosphatase family protein [Thiofilum flexile]|uniref:protein-tyrosine phosphatase family protein n=1 Tax=Thiofilum flexile TaxID=125627 RepID=UPI00037CF0B1|nr:protein-tyrosine phosphatase family protein [Thiofilum flexile]
MTPDIFWIKDITPLRLAVMPRPRAGEWLVDEIAGFAHLGVSVIVSLLEPHEVVALGLQDEQALCTSHGIELLSYPIADRNVPESMLRTHIMISSLVDRLHKGESVAIHCRAGIGRTGLIAGCVLTQLGYKPAEALQIISTARRVQVPDTEQQKEWLSRYAQAYPYQS